jgi:hypothetical protein
MKSEGGVFELRLEIMDTSDEIDEICRDEQMFLDSILPYIREALKNTNLEISDWNAKMLEEPTILEDEEETGESADA